MSSRASSGRRTTGSWSVGFEPCATSRARESEQATWAGGSSRGLVHGLALPRLLDEAWVADEACVTGQAVVRDFAQVRNNAIVRGSAAPSGSLVATIGGHAMVKHEAVVAGFARILDDAVISGAAEVRDQACVYQMAWVQDSARVGDEAYVCERALVAGSAQLGDRVLVGGDAVVTDDTTLSGDRHHFGSVRPIHRYSRWKDDLPRRYTFGNGHREPVDVGPWGEAWQRVSFGFWGEPESAHRYDLAETGWSLARPETTVYTASIYNTGADRPLVDWCVRFSGFGGSLYEPAWVMTDETGRASIEIYWAAFFFRPGEVVEMTARISPTDAIPGVDYNAYDRVNYPDHDYVATMKTRARGSNAYALGPWDHGALGTNRNEWAVNPTPLASVFQSPIVDIACGAASTYALLEDGSVWAVGANDRGQLGDGSSTSRDTWAPVPGVPDVARIWATSDSAVATRHDGTHVSWGAHSDPTALGVGAHNSAFALRDLVTFSREHVWQVTDDGRVVSFGAPQAGGFLDDAAIPRVVRGLSNVVQISAAGDVGYAMLADGSVFRWKGLGMAPDEVPRRVNDIPYVRRLATAGIESDRMYFIRG